jgi:general secretion pathway protein F
MQRFDYVALDAAGRKQSGNVSAHSLQEANVSVAGQGMTVLELHAAPGSDGAQATASPALRSGADWAFWRSRKASAQEILLALQELSTLLSAGISLADGVYEISIGHGGGPLGEHLQQIYGRLRAGRGFAAALEEVAQQAQWPLPQYALQLLRAGEETGKLAQSLASCCEQMAADAQFRRETRNALTYPMVLVGSGVLASLVVFVFVVPKFASFLSHPKADIPAFSRWVLQMGLWLVQNKLLAFGLSAGAVVAVAWAFGQKAFRQSLWEFGAQMPFVGRWIGQIELGRWAGMLSVLLHNRVPLLDALRHSANSLTTEARRARANAVWRDVQGGQPLAIAAKAHGLVDAVGLNLIRVGEQSGKLAHTMGSLGDMLRGQARQTMQQFLVLLEPVTILLVSVFLGGIMISVMMAITSLTNVI